MTLLTINSRSTAQYRRYGEHKHKASVYTYIIDIYSQMFTVSSPFRCLVSFSKALKRLLPQSVSVTYKATRIIIFRRATICSVVRAESLVAFFDSCVINPDNAVVPAKMHPFNYVAKSCGGGGVLGIAVCSRAISVFRPLRANGVRLWKYFLNPQPSTRPSPAQSSPVASVYLRAINI